MFGMSWGILTNGNVHPVPVPKPKMLCFSHSLNGVFPFLANKKSASD
jgi:hypothetical protein